jgi:hypothetical protein
MLGTGWVKVKGKRGRDKKHESLSPFTFKEPNCLGVLLAGLKQKSSPNKAETSFMRGKYVTING